MIMLNLSRCLLNSDDWISMAKFLSISEVMFGFTSQIDAMEVFPTIQENTLALTEQIVGGNEYTTFIVINAWSDIGSIQFVCMITKNDWEHESATWFYFTMSICTKDWLANLLRTCKTFASWYSHCKWLLKSMSWAWSHSIESLECGFCNH